MRAVFDTNVLVSALLIPESTPGALLLAWRRGALDLVTSQALLAELRVVLERPRVMRRLQGARSEDVPRLMELLPQRAIVVDPPETLDVVRDPDDNRVIEAAVAGGVDYIVTGDHDLLALGEHEGIEIITPARFLAILSTGS